MFVAKFSAMPVSVVEENKETTWAVYPNPGTGIFTIQSSTEISDCKIIVTDVSGRDVFEKRHPGAGNTFEVDLRKYPNGIYFLKFSDSKNVITNRLVKL
jgi:hypothetical protein